MGTTGLIAVLVALSGPTATITDAAKAKQNEVFQRLWGTEFIWKYNDLPAEGAVPKFRLPYSGYIYPDKQGGTVSALSKYDRAFNRGRPLATAHERWDTTAFKKPTKKRGLFGFGRTVMETPNWHGHCNGWVTATIRHAEPQKSVRFGGVSFTPADIKALLAEIYMYNDLDHLVGLKHAMNAGTFHAIIANWIGRGRHPLGMEADPSEEKWNYPIYAYATSSAKRSERLVEVKMNLAYIKDSNGEYQVGPHIQRYKHFHYQLHLDNNGIIIGGGFYRDSSMIDLLWIPMRPKPSRAKGNESGNPYVNVERVLAIWRASVPEAERKKWLVIDPTIQDRIAQVPDDVEGLVPVQIRPARPTETSVAAGGTGNSDGENGGSAEVNTSDSDEEAPAVADAADAAAETPTGETDVAATDGPSLGPATPAAGDDTPGETTEVAAPAASENEPAATE